MDSRRLLLWRWILVAWAGAWAVMFLPRLLLGPAPAFGVIQPTRVVVTAACAAVAMVWTYAFGFYAYRKLDEFQQEAGKFSWYIGGSAGLAVSAVAFTFLAWGGWRLLDATAPVSREAFNAFRLGFAVPVLCQLAGFIAVRVWWQVAKR